MGENNTNTEEGRKKVNENKKEEEKERKKRENSFDVRAQAFIGQSISIQAPPKRRKSELTSISYLPPYCRNADCEFFTSLVKLVRRSIWLCVRC